MRFGLFGTGPWAHLAHAPALAELAGQHGTRAYADQDALIADVDAVAVALPPDVQAPLALRAARAGRHLLLDKPVAFTNAEAAEIVAAVTERDLASVVFFTRRLMPQLAEFIAGAVATGGWVEGRVDHFGSIFTGDNPFGASAWRRESGGLWDVGPHALALVLPVLGPVTEVAGLAGPRDMTHLLLRHAGGAISNLTLTVDAPPAAEREDAAFSGEAGVLAVPKMPWQPIEALQTGLDQLMAAAAGGPASEFDVRFGAEVTAVLVAAQESINSGRAVPVG